MTSSQYETVSATGTPIQLFRFFKPHKNFNDDWANDPESRNQTSATVAEMDDVGDFLSGENWFEFPTLEEQLREEWLGGTVAADMKGQLDFFVEIGDLTEAKYDFSSYVDSSFLEKATE